MHYITSVEDLNRIAKDRSKDFDPDKHIAYCGPCGAPLTMLGILHWPDCLGLDGDIRFKNK